MPQEPFPVAWLGGAAVITLPEEIDLSNADQVRDGLLALLNRGPSVLIVDMAGTTFCDSAGINALVRAHKRAAANDAEIRLVVASPGVRRVLAITGIDRLVAVYPTVTESLADAGSVGEPGDLTRPDPDHDGWAAQPG